MRTELVLGLPFRGTLAQQWQQQRQRSMQRLRPSVERFRPRRLHYVVSGFRAWYSACTAGDALKHWVSPARRWNQNHVRRVMLKDSSAGVCAAVAGSGYLTRPTYLPTFRGGLWEEGGMGRDNDYRMYYFLTITWKRAMQRTPKST